eukprot:COSAG02_NODE_6381_length_3610_cov_1.367417_1_plen_741_part_10
MGETLKNEMLLRLLMLATAVVVQVAACTLTDDATKACEGTCSTHELVDLGCETLNGGVEDNWETCQACPQPQSPPEVSSLRSVTGHVRLHHSGVLHQSGGSMVHEPSTGIRYYSGTPEQCRPSNIDCSLADGRIRFPALETVGGDFEITDFRTNPYRYGPQDRDWELDFTSLRTVGGNFAPPRHREPATTFANLTTVDGHAIFGRRSCAMPLAGYVCPSSDDPYCPGGLCFDTALQLPALQHVGGTLWLAATPDVRLPVLETAGSLIFLSDGPSPTAGNVVYAPLLREVSGELRLGGPVDDVVRSPAPPEVPSRTCTRDGSDRFTECASNVHFPVYDFGRGNRTNRPWSIHHPDWTKCPDVRNDGIAWRSTGWRRLGGCYNDECAANGATGARTTMHKQFAPHPSRPDTSFASLVHVAGALKVIDLEHVSSLPLFPALRTVGADAWFLDFVDTPGLEPSMTLPVLETVGGRLRIEATKCYIPPGLSCVTGTHTAPHCACAVRLASPVFPALTSTGSLWIGSAVIVPVQGGPPNVRMVSFPRLAHVEFQMVLNFVHDCVNEVCENDSNGDCISNEHCTCADSHWSLNPSGCSSYHTSHHTVYSEVSSRWVSSRLNTIAGTSLSNTAHSNNIAGTGSIAIGDLHHSLHSDEGVSVEFPALQTLGGRGTWPQIASALDVPDYGCDSSRFVCGEENETAYRSIGSVLLLALPVTRTISFPALRWTDHSIHFRDTNMLTNISFPAV